jgi:hypothetical protein
MGVDLCLEIEREVFEKQKSMYVQGKRRKQRTSLSWRSCKRCLKDRKDMLNHLLCLIPFFEPAHHGRDVVGGCTEVVCSSGISTYVKPVPTSWFAGSSMTSGVIPCYSMYGVYVPDRPLCWSCLRC